MAQEKLKPRAHQKRGVNEAWRLSKLEKNVLVVSPGGSGKTLMIAMLVKLAIADDKTVLVLAHRKELIDQAKRHLVQHGINGKRIGVLVGQKKDLPAFMNVLVASIQTFTKRDIELADVVVIDEAHRAPTRSYQLILDQCARGCVFGFTATPTRLDNVALETTFDEMVEAAKTSRLISRGLIAKPVCFSSIEAFIPDLRDVTIRGRGQKRDFDHNQLKERVDTPELNGNVVEHYYKRAKGKQAIAFMVSILHAQHIADRFNARGISAEVFHGKLSPTQRDLVLGRFKNKKTMVLCTVDIANEGLDVPFVRAAIFARPTTSFTVFMQQCARVMRPGTQATILDHAGNILRHGLPYIDREYSLSGALEEVPEAAKVKMCPACQHLVQCGDLTCEACGYEFPRPQRKLLIGEDESKLTNLQRNAFKKKIKALAKQKGVGDTWVNQIMMKYSQLLEVA